MCKIFIVIVLGCCCQSATSQVYVSGAMRNIMQQGDLRATVALDTLLNKKRHVYGLGAAAGLKGEIIILDDQVYLSTVEGDVIITKKQTTAQASMLVYASVKAWSTPTIVTHAITLKSLAIQVDSIARQNGVDITRPFPFIIKIKKGRIDYHVIDWKDGVEHTTENHKQFAKKGSFENKEIVLLGFFSKNHQGVFTHHDSTVHVHAIDVAHSIVGHVDEIMFSIYELILPVALY